jgi:hypothetical protein
METGTDGPTRNDDLAEGVKPERRASVSIPKDHHWGKRKLARDR